MEDRKKYKTISKEEKIEILHEIENVLEMDQQKTLLQKLNQIDYHTFDEILLKILPKYFQVWSFVKITNLYFFRMMTFLLNKD